MHKIACLHTADSNVSVFAAAAEGMPIELSHAVRPDLLQLAEAAGGLTPDIARMTASALSELGQGADAVILTCSTLGPSVSDVGGATPMLRADAALARAATRSGGKVKVLYAVSSTLQPTQAVFKAAQLDAVTCVEIEFEWITGAWDLFKAGQIEAYYNAIARAADHAFAAGYDVVALAQASMSPAATLTKRGMPLSSPRAALIDALSQASGDDNRTKA